MSDYGGDNDAEEKYDFLPLELLETPKETLLIMGHS
jgi:hypothetical protein